MEVLTWRTHLPPVLTAAMILILAAWLIVLFRRQRTHRAWPQTIVLLLPKVAISLLLIVAYLDPVRSVIRAPKKDKTVMVLADVSTSMDCKDQPAVSRADRAEALCDALAERLGSLIDFDVTEFAMDVLEPGEGGADNVSLRGTNLAKTLMTAARRVDPSEVMAAILVTDGGDEMVEDPVLPRVPLHVVGLGTEPETWDDLGIVGVTAPSVVEAGAKLEVSADLVARFATQSFEEKIPVAQVRLEEEQSEAWQVRRSDYLRFSEGRTRARFSIDAPSEPGTQTYRITVDRVPGELSFLNNLRTFDVEVREDTLQVLFFAQTLGWDFSMIRKALAQDPSVGLTALFRVSEERFVVQGQRQPGDEQLEAGFPRSKTVLDLFQCVIVGSFDAAQWHQDQQAALVDYVRDGGAVVFLGGERSFGLGGYAGTPLEPLFPWQIGGGRSDFQVGSFGVSVPAPVLSNPLIAETARLISQLRSVSVESVNIEGPVKRGAVTLLEVSAAGRSLPLIAMQRFGRGHTMAIATNTLWKWRRASAELAEAHGHLWGQTVKNMSGWEEGQRFLSVRWDQQQYNPGEVARAEIRVAGRHDQDRLSLTAEKTVEGRTTPVTVEPMLGRDSAFTVEIGLPPSAETVVTFQALVGDQVLESYRKTLRVGTQLNEGANLAVDHAFLNSLASRGGGMYFRETQSDQLIEMLRNRVLAQAASVEIPLIEDRGIYILVFVGLLVLEWIIRRKMNLL